MSAQVNVDDIAYQVAAQLDCTQDVVCRHILRSIAETGQPVVTTQLAALLQISQEELHMHLHHVPDTEFDEQGNIVGWGITLVPTAHQIYLQGKLLYTWCAFDTLLFPSLLHVEAHIHSICEASRQPITFVATPTGIEELLPTTSVLSLIVPNARCDCVRGTFCQQSLFFHSVEAAIPWCAVHPEAVLLSLEEAALVGQTIARIWP